MRPILNPVSIALALPVCFFAASCNAIYEDLRPCRNEVRVKFNYDRNMDFRDCFSKDVHSVDVWAFDASGEFIWHGSEKGDALKKDDFYLLADIEPGVCDFVSWCSLDDNEGYDLNSYTPAVKEDLFLTLARIKEENGMAISSSRLPMVFNGILGAITVENATTSDRTQDIIMDLAQDSKNINISIAGPRDYDPQDFDVAITSAENCVLSYDNNPSGQVDYLPWNASTTKSRAHTGVTYNLSTSRLMAESECHLSVTRNGDNVIDVPLVPLLLERKKYYQVRMGNQEYLDRENTYNIEFTLDEKEGFDLNSVIYINGWAIVPTQVENPK